MIGAGWPIKSEATSVATSTIHSGSGNVHQISHQNELRSPGKSSLALRTRTEPQILSRNEAWVLVQLAEVIHGRPARETRKMRRPRSNCTATEVCFDWNANHFIVELL
jgi:hypothetical protein